MMMTSVMRNLFLAAPLAGLLAACGSAPIVLSEEEKAASPSTRSRRT
jgi:predicted small lipoprotein YifL